MDPQAIQLGESLSATLLRAQRLALRRGQVLCEPQHLLWALLADDMAAPSIELRRQGHDVARIRQRVEAELPPAMRAFGDARAYSASDGVLRVSPALKAILDTAGELAAAGASSEIGERTVLEAFAIVDRPDIRAIVERVGLTGSASSDPRGSEGTRDTTAILRMIGQYGRDLTAEAWAGRLDPVIGRDEELRRVTHILGRRRKNNPVLIGYPGVGKTAIVEGLAQAIAADAVPDAIKGKHIFALDIGSLVAGTKYRGEFEERVQILLDTLAQAKGSIILFIDELHLIARAGGAEGAIDAASFFKPLLARGDLHAIGATTVDEYRDHIAPDGALERRFQPVFVREPTAEETVAMLRGLRATYESFHEVSILDAALEEAVRLGVRYLPDRRLPDKAIDLVDEAASGLRAGVYGRSIPAEGATESVLAGGRRAHREVGAEDVRRVVEEWIGGDGAWAPRVYSARRDGFLRRILGHRRRN